MELKERKLTELKVVKFCVESVPILVSVSG